MQIERDGSGDLIIQSAELAQRFGLSLGELRRAMRLKLFISSVEIGMDADQGTSRLTLRCGNRVWRAILDADDRVTSEEMRMVRTPPGRT